MKILAYPAAALLLIGGATTALAKPADAGKERPLASALQAMVHVATTPPGQSHRPDDPDMGDDNAALQAILTVCTMNTPAAERSAICDGAPVSPD